MRAVSLSEANSFSEGSQLWIIRNDPSLIWWKKLDLQTRYLLSQFQLRQKKLRPPELETIVAETYLKTPEYNFNSQCVLIGTEDHLLNKWIFLWNDLNNPALIEQIEHIIKNLKIESVRFFSDSDLIKQLETRPTASSLSITYIENI